MMREPITTAQLRGMGIHTAQIRSMLASGALTRLRRGVFTSAAPGDALQQHELLIRATVGEVADSNVFSHTSAAVLHGLPVRHADLGVATMTRTSPGHSSRGTHLKVRNTVLDSDEFEPLGDHLATTLARTVADQARTAPLEWGVITADAALAGGLTRAGLLAALDRHPRLKGVTRARTVSGIADGRSESPAESLSRLRMIQARLPAPELQYELFDASGQLVARCDYGWPEYGVVGEVDGRVKYDELVPPGRGASDVVMAEKRREERIRDLGLWLVRWGWDDAWQGDPMVRRIRSALDGGPRAHDLRWRGSPALQRR